MKIITKYVISEYLKMLCYSLLTFTTLYLVVDFFERFDMFVKYKAEMSVAVKYFLLKTPFILYQITPVAVLLSTLLTFGILSKNNEITAMKACGISIYKISTPLILIAFIITALSFFNSEYIAPYANASATAIKNSLKKTEPKYVLKHNKIWYTGKDVIYNIDYFDSKTGELNGVTVFNFDDDFNLISRTDAKSGHFTDNSWRLRDAVVRKFSYVEGAMKVSETKTSSTERLPLLETPETLKEVRRKPEEMSYGELKQFISKVKREGYNASEHEVDLQAKLSIPFISIIMTIIGVPFALKNERSGSIAVGIGLSIVIGFCYWIALSFSLSLGHAGVLPPIIAAWVSFFIFLLIGIYMFLTIRD